MRIMNYGLILIALLLIIFIAFIPLKVNVPATTNAQVPLNIAMQALGAETQQAILHGWAVLPRQDASEEELTAIVEAAAKELMLPAIQTKMSSSASGRHRLVRADLTEDNMQTAIIAQVLYSSNPGKSAEVYMMINMDGRNNSIQNAKEHKILQIIANQGAKAHISTCLIGWLDGKLDDGEMRFRLNHAFSAIHALVHDTVTDFYYTSMSGYSPDVDESLIVNDKKVNVNMAMRYSPTDNRTYCIVGLPVITEEY